MTANGQPATDAEESEIISARLENGNRPKESRSAHQKRYDKLMRRISALRDDNCEFRELLLRYEATISKYKMALQKMRVRDGH